MPKFKIGFSINVASKEEAIRFIRAFLDWTRSVGMETKGNPKVKFVQEKEK